MPTELIKPIIEGRAIELTSECEQACSGLFDELTELLLSSEINRIELEDIYIKLCSESVKFAYGRGMLDGMKIHNFCTK